MEQILRDELSKLLAHVLELRHAFYVVGKPSAVKAAFDKGHELIRSAKDAITAHDTPFYGSSIFDEEPANEG